MPAFDNDLMFRTTGNLTASMTTSALKVRGLPVAGMAVRIVVPSSVGTTNTLLARVHGSNDDSAYNLVAQHPGGTIAPASGVATELIIPLAGDKKYYKVDFVVAGSTGTPNWGAVKAGLVEGVGFDWTRAVDWS
jgi:hypothetical protein